MDDYQSLKIIFIVTGKIQLNKIFFDEMILLFLKKDWKFVWRFKDPTEIVKLLG
jgi:hypothetical protein